MNMEDICTTKDCLKEAKPGFSGKCFTCGINAVREENGLTPMEKDETPEPSELHCEDCGTPAREVKSFNEEKKKCRSCLVKTTKAAKKLASAIESAAPSEKGVFTEREREREDRQPKGTPVKEAAETTMVLDFTDYPELLEKLKAAAKDNFRGMAGQALFLLKESLP